MKTRLGIAIPLLAVVLGLGGCSQTRNNRSQADNVRNALEQADLKDVHVADDADKNTVTLTGTLHSDDAKNKAGEVAKSAAPDRIIANEISVQPVGNESDAKAVSSNLDDGIENNYKAALISKHLNKQSIRYDAKNGVLTLKGSVKSPAQKVEAERLASNVPNVQQVVNQIEINR